MATIIQTGKLPNSTTLLENGYTIDNQGQIIQLGIQTLPGVVFYLNGSTTPIRIGASGIFDLDLSNGSTRISKIEFDNASVARINDSGYLIVDMLV